MGDKSAIEWTDATWNPVVGCSIVSPGCTNCYAMATAHGLERRFGSAKYGGLTKVVNGHPVWTGEVRLAEEALAQPLRWRRPRRIFVNSMSDLFHDSLPEEAIDRVFAVMALAPQHTFQILTKRAARMRAYMARVALERIAEAVPAGEWPITQHEAQTRITGEPTPAATMYRCERPAWPLPNVWLGVSVEDQARADERIPQLLATPAAQRFLSCEPLLGPVDLRFLQPGDPPVEIDALNGTHGVLRPHRGTNARVDWVIVGGESGPGARPMHPDWARSLRDQCQAAHVPFFFKQWGEFADLTSDPPGSPLLKASVEDRIFTATGETLGVGCRSGRQAFGSVDEDWRDRGGAWMSRVGKRRAGRLLDGRTWDEIPK